jgi:hypothetical protein
MLLGYLNDTLNWPVACAQHISAGAINETARLVGIVGTNAGVGPAAGAATRELDGIGAPKRAPPASPTISTAGNLASAYGYAAGGLSPAAIGNTIAGGGGAGAGALQPRVSGRARTPRATSNIAGGGGSSYLSTAPSSSRSILAGLAQPPAVPVPAPVPAAMVAQHASQITRLAAGLDFLEQHILRQDAALEALQQRTAAPQAAIEAAAAPKASSMGGEGGEGRCGGGGPLGLPPRELALQVHDLGEALGKLRGAVAKVGGCATGRWWWGVCV